MGQIKRIHEMLVNKEISCVDLTKKYLEAIENSNKELNAYITVTPDVALAQAEAVDKKIILTPILDNPHNNREEEVVNNLFQVVEEFGNLKCLTAVFRNGNSNKGNRNREVMYIISLHLKQTVQECPCNPPKTI